MFMSSFAKKANRSLIVIVLMISLLFSPLLTVKAYAKTDISQTSITVHNTTYCGTNTKTYIEIYDSNEWNDYELSEGTDYTVKYSNNSKVGTATVTITGKGDYSGSISKTFKINAINVNDCWLQDYYDNEYVYTGSPVTKKISLSYEAGFDYNYVSYDLKKGVDYKVEYKNNVNAGKATYTIKGIGNCTGTMTKDSYGDPLEFQIYKADIEEATVTGLKTVTYRADGKYTQSPVVTYKGKTLKLGTDYTFEIDKELGYGGSNYSKGYVYIYGKGNFEGTKEATFKINYIDISPAKITLKSGKAVPYDDYRFDEGISDYFNVTLNNKALKISKNDYPFDDEKNDCYIEVVGVSGTKVLVKAVGINTYTSETAQASFALKRGLSAWYYFDESTGAKEDYNMNFSVPYTGKAIKPSYLRVYGVLPKSEVELKDKTHYTITYKNNVNVGTATIIISGKGDYAGQEKRETYKIVPASIKNATVTGIKASYTGTKKEIKPTPTVQLKLAGSTRTLKAGTDYTVTYSNNIKAGTATVTIKGKGNFTGTVSKNFKITAPPKATVRRVSGANRFGTATAVANAYKIDSKQTGGLKYAVVANAFSAPDALSAGPLAAKYKAPILLVDKSQESNVLKWIKSNVKKGGTIYLVGGKLVVRDQFLNAVKKAGYKCERVAGNDRIQTNLAVLKKVGITTKTEVLVAEGSFKTVNGAKNSSFHEALIASATGKPLLLVGAGGLTKDQLAYLKKTKVKSFTIIGSASSTTPVVETSLKTINKSVSRITGTNPDVLSVEVAKKYWPKGPKQVFLATSNGFADALSGGPLCVSNNGPIFLINDKQYSSTSKYLKGLVLTRVNALGGKLVVPDALIKKVADVK